MKIQEYVIELHEADGSVTELSRGRMTRYEARRLRDIERNARKDQRCSVHERWVGP